MLAVLLHVSWWAGLTPSTCTQDQQKAEAIHSTTATSSRLTKLCCQGVHDEQTHDSGDGGVAEGCQHGGSQSHRRAKSTGTCSQQKRQQQQWVGRGAAECWVDECTPIGVLWSTRLVQGPTHKGMQGSTSPTAIWLHVTEGSKYQTAGTTQPTTLHCVQQCEHALSAAAPRLSERRAAEAVRHVLQGQYTTLQYNTFSRSKTVSGTSPVSRPASRYSTQRV